MSSSILTAWTSSTTVCSANTEAAAKFQAGSPPTVNGWVMLPMLFLHRVGHPVAHAAHRPQLARVVTTTWSPGATVVTSLPTSSTTPAPSWPITTGVGNGIVPSSTDWSLWHTPAATIRTRTSPGPGSLTSTASLTTAPVPSKTIALIQPGQMTDCSSV